MLEDRRPIALRITTGPGRTLGAVVVGGDPASAAAAVREADETGRVLVVRARAVARVGALLPGTLAAAAAACRRAADPTPGRNSRHAALDAAADALEALEPAGEGGVPLWG